MTKQTKLTWTVIHDDSEVFNDDENAEGEVIVKSWWAEREGLV